MFQKWKEYLKEVRIELKRVSWPNRKEILGSTGVVLVGVLIVTVYIWVVDIILSEIIKLIMGIGGK